MKPAIKGGLILSLSVVASLLFLNSVEGQPRPGSFSGRPGGGVSGGMAGRPGGGISGTNIGGPRPGAATGGISGTISGTRPGMTIGGTNIGGPGPRPGTAIGGASGMGVTGGMGITGGMGAIGGMTTIYTCPNCRREVGRGNSPPAMVNCCGTTYVNGKSLRFGPGPGAAGPGAGGGGNPVIPPSQPFQPSPSTTYGTPDPASTAASGFSGMTLAIGVGVVLFGLVILGGVIVLIVQSQKKGAGVPSRRRRGREDYY
jgi:hypothetical protein